MSGLVLWALVAVAGAAGALLRWIVSELPVGIFVVNVSACLVLGVLVGASVRGNAYLLAGTAFVGAYSTYSTWMVDAERLAEAGRARAAVLDVGASLVVGLGALALGRWIGSAA